MSEATAEPTTDAPVETPETDAPETGAAEPEIDWKAKAREWEKRAKENSAKLKAIEPKAREYDRLEQASKTETQLLQEQLNTVNQRAAAAVQRAARAEIGKALAGVVDDPDTILDDLNIAKFVDEDGDVDQAAVTELREKYARFGARRTPRPDASQASGANGRSNPDPREEFGSILQNAFRAPR